MAEKIMNTEERRAKIMERSSIANMTPLKSAVTEEVSFALGSAQNVTEATLVSIRSEARKRNLGPLHECVDEILKRDDLSDQTRQTFNNLFDQIKKGGDTADLLPFETGNGDNAAGNLIPEIMLTAFLKDSELRPILMETVDKVVKRKSDANLREIDELAEEGKRKVFGMGVVGGGPISSVYLTAAGPFVNNVLITEHDRIGEPWRSRLFIYVNTEVKGSENGNPPIPLMGGGTTPIAAMGLKEAIHLGYLSDEDDLSVGNETFISGGKVGDASALNSLAYADNFLVGQKVLLERTRILPNGNKLLVLKDTSTEKIREIEVSPVVFLTGPGNEFLPIYDSKSREDYRISMEMVDEYILDIRRQIQSGEKVTLPELPKILTGGALEKLLRLWVVDLKGNPNLYPLSELFDPRKRIAVIGGGDSGKTCNEFLGLNSPKDAYPKGFKESAKVSRRDAYRFQTRKELWSRYRKTAVDAKTKRKNVKVATITLEGKGVKICDTAGKRRDYDFAFVSLGYERQAIEQTLSNISNIPIGRIRDMEGEPVAMGYEAGGVYIGGSAMGFKYADYPKRLQEIIDINNSEKDPISLWINAILAERMAYSVINQNGVTVNKVRELYEASKLT